MAIIEIVDKNSSVANFSVNNVVITVEGVTIDCAERQGQDEKHIEIRVNNGVVSESYANGSYVAVIVIPAYRYNPEQNDVPIPIDANAIILKLWPFAHNTIN